MQNFTASDVEVVDEVLSYDGFYKIRSLKLRHRLFSGDWSETISRELFDRHEAVGILLYDPDLDAVALVEQFRIGALDRALNNNESPWLLELVAGLIDNDESPEVVGIREAEEEANAVVQQLEPICEYYSSAGGSNEYLYLFCGKVGLSQAGGVFGLKDECEDIKVHVLSVEQCFQYLHDGSIRNAHTLIAMQWLALNHQRIRQQWLATTSE